MNPIVDIPSEKMEELQICNLRHGVIERGEGAWHHGDVHHVPEVPHVGPGVEHKPLVQNLQISLQISANILWLDPGPWSIVASLQERERKVKHAVELDTYM